MLLAGCNQEEINTGSGSDSGATTPPTPPVIPTTYISTLMASGKTITGDVYCNGKSLNSDTGTFTVKEGSVFDCSLGGLTLGEFTAPSPKAKAVNVANTALEASFDLQDVKGANATKVLQSISTCKQQDSICLDDFDSIDIQEIYTDENLAVQDVVDAFIALKKKRLTK